METLAQDQIRRAINPSEPIQNSERQSNDGGRAKRSSGADTENFTVSQKCPGGVRSLLRAEQCFDQLAAVHFQVGSDAAKDGVQGSHFELLMGGDGQVVLMASCFRREAHVASGLAGDFVTVLTQ